ncbi:DNAJ heat shock N-terminal domain-containing protein [Basidiobolus meristosporus CBS 931.73]|uniref:Diphthamide biosynthesis protein 4 n=1 Tax=Basidiobolus meristosporus CBS 931.73 TaxID=1314790 RepID=A0A1Y1ZBR1_9FUNG|nr:DNAJ heat shock N-terminal domain-containing protein [Basidiobolus meristosporus CBS 931.73]|eukprot:ORY07732.1 DNAJ heat shock N-terminal domain-containing protein [Basidiobolus meristosporus CBS 931.73]
MTNLPDHYATLGISELATQEEIKKQYQRLVLKHHPDKLQQENSGPQDGEEFRKISEAWNVLKDSINRANYDTNLKAFRLKQLGLVNGEIDLDEMEFDEETETYYSPCRCSGHYSISVEDLERGADLAACEQCSLQVRVLYEVLSEEE